MEISSWTVAGGTLPGSALTQKPNCTNDHLPRLKATRGKIPTTQEEGLTLLAADANSIFQLMIPSPRIPAQQTYQPRELADVPADPQSGKWQLTKKTKAAQD
ncbi:Hypothetical predicted protein [Pelobates cultripes]|uniref:Uncharacterized protein n=1 Tax=Pelobates cultripes TaxID=61616 RepID=A0AAD1T1Y4_PELCU|nr:Hypothetical predicted protein [Pelobates cultripes]